jgi:hypothetical protein
MAQWDLGRGRRLGVDVLAQCDGVQLGVRNVDVLIRTSALAAIRFDKLVCGAKLVPITNVREPQPSAPESGFASERPPERVVE